MIVFVEGVDGSGKTTLVKQLRELGYTTKYCERGVDNTYGYFKLCADDTHTYIFDRGPISDIVYRLTDDRPRDNMTLTCISKILDTSKIIHCKQPKAYEYAMIRGEDSIINKCLHAQVVIYYEKIMLVLKKFSTAKIIEYDWSTDNITNIIKFIEEEQ